MNNSARRLSRARSASNPRRMARCPTMIYPFLKGTGRDPCSRGRGAMGKRIAMLLAGALALGLTGYAAVGAGKNPGAEAIAANNALFLDGNQGDDWPAYGRTFGEQHFSPLTQINDQTV